MKRKLLNNKIMSGTLLVLLSLLVSTAIAQEELEPCAIEKDRLGYDRYIFKNDPSFLVDGVGNQF